MYLSARTRRGSLSPSDFGDAGSSSTATDFAGLFVDLAAGPSDSGLLSSSSFVASALFASSLSLPDSLLLSVFELGELELGDLELGDLESAEAASAFESERFSFALASV